jgi:hypothetical protein
MIYNKHLIQTISPYVLGLFFLLPSVSQAAVFINEVAWMGSQTSANHEWIELYNDGSGVNVDDWILSDGRNVSITLAGTIPANAYAVLERTDDESAPGTAFLLYTGALVNTGGTLRLETAHGELADVVSGGENWDQIGGDNTTKETAQYTQKGWITAAATPGAQNKTQPTTVQTPPEESTPTEEDKPSTSSKSKSSVETVRLILPDVTLDVAIDAQSVGYVNQTIPFYSSASGIGETLLDSLQYQWNFGDGTTAQSDTADHAFSFPGTYVVTLHSQFKRQKYTARHEITILPVALSLTQNSHGDIQLNNDSPYEVDISGYTVKGRETFVFPDYSIILPNQTITIPRQKLTATYPAMVTVYDTHNVSLASQLPSTIKRSQLAQAEDKPLALATQFNTQQNNISLATQAIPTASEPTAIPTPATPADQGEVLNATADADPLLAYAAPDQLKSREAPPTTPTRTQRLSYVGLAIIILLGILAVYLTPRRNQTD